MAKKRAVVGPDLTPDWLEKRRGIMGEIDKQLIRGLREPGKGLTLDDLQKRVVEHRNPFRSSVAMDISETLTPQQLFYRQFFGMELDFSQVPIPQHQPGFDRLIIVAQGLTPNRVYEVCAQHFPCWRYNNDLDTALDWDKEERNPKDGPYAIWVRDRQEADEELKNLSADDIKTRCLTTETLTERELHGLMYWSETKKHPDVDNITLCSGSRSRDGGVPGVDWYGGRLKVLWYDSDDASDGLRSRQVVRS
ncbi:MAG: hypothetical protein WAP55_00555 [Minisyncoccia bacterium]